MFAAHAPPSPAASAQILGRRISGAEQYFGIIHQQDRFIGQFLAASCISIKPFLGNYLRWPILWRFEQLGWYWSAVREALRQVNFSEWDVIFAYHPNMAFALAAARVAKIAGKPLVLHLNDLFSESRSNPVEKLWARASEERLMKQASVVICLTEGMQQHYARKYEIDPVFIPHSVTEQEIHTAYAKKQNLEMNSPVVIAYAGGVYQARLDSLIAVKQAIDSLNDQGFPTQLLVLGKNDGAQLASWGLGGDYVDVLFIEDRSEFMNALRRSDILLSTVAFRSDYPLQDKTCFPTKTFDYFLAGKPILVVAPDDSHYAGYMQRYQCGSVTGVLDVQQIAFAIQRLVTDLEYRRKLVESGRRRLQAHSQNRVQPRFRRMLAEACAPSCGSEVKK
jgi:glycosyltransferase involved in cell wall biosynthesis